MRFRALYILNGYVKSVQMEGAQNSDSEAHVKKYDRTSGKKFKLRIGMGCFETPCILAVTLFCGHIAN